MKRYMLKCKQFYLAISAIINFLNQFNTICGIKVDMYKPKLLLQSVLFKPFYIHLPYLQTYRIHIFLKNTKTLIEF